MKNTQLFLNRMFKSNLVLDGVIGPKSKAAMTVAIKALKKLFDKKKYAWIDNSIVAIRDLDLFTNEATDWLVFIGTEELHAVPCSTRAGDYWVFNPITYGGITGTAVLKEGQYINTYRFTTSSNWSNLWLQTPYLMQEGKVTIYRDGNKDRVINKDVTQSGWFGINIHTAGWTSIVDRWSAGCIVVPREEWLAFLSNFKANGLYTLTLLTRDELQR